MNEPTCQAHKPGSDTELCGRRIPAARGTQKIGKSGRIRRAQPVYCSDRCKNREQRRRQRAKARGL